MENSKKYWIFWTKWTIVYLKEKSWFKLDYKNMDDYWILFFGKIVLSNDMVKLNRDWSSL